jgi:hypothetical protein
VRRRAQCGPDKDAFDRGLCGLVDEIGLVGRVDGGGRGGLVLFVRNLLSSLDATQAGYTFPSVFVGLQREIIVLSIVGFL